MAEQKKQWKLDGAKGIADALEWLRQRTEGKALLLIAVGRNGIAFSKHPDVKAEDAVHFIEEELGNLKIGLQRLDAEGQRRGAQSRKEY